MKNKKIKTALAIYNLKQWELAKILGISEYTMCRRLRFELPEEEQDRIVSIIEKAGVSIE